MTQPRLPHARATERRTGGTEATETPCAGQWFVYDILVDNSSGPAYRNAIAEARAICATCPISTACLLANRDEEWAQAVITGQTMQQRVKAGTYTKRQRYVTSHEQRLADLTAWAESGHNADTAAARLGISRDSLGSWCRKNGHRDVWERLTREEVAA